MKEIETVGDVRKLVQEGKSAGEIWEAMISRYGADAIRPFWETPRRNISAFIQACAQNFRIANPVIDMGCGRRSHRPEVLASIGQNISYIAFDHFIHLPESVEPERLPNFSADILSIPICDQCAGSVICSEVLEHVPDDRRAVCEMARVLRPGGRLIMTLPGRDIPSHAKPPYQIDYRRYSPRQIRDLLDEGGFNNIEVLEKDLWGLEINLLVTAQR